MHPGSLLFYCQSSLGMGHLVRSLSLARELARRFRVVFLFGGRLPRGVEVPPELRFVQLPPIGDLGKGLVSLDGRRSLRRASHLRRLRLLEAFREIRARVIVIEYFPFGRPKFEPEIVALLEAARRAGRRRPLVFCSLRDILKPEERGHHRNDHVAGLVNEFYDGVLVHAADGFARLEESFQSSVPLSVPVYYTGFIAARPPVADGGRRRDRVLVSAGGGRPGAPLLSAAVDAFTRHGIGEGVGMTVTTGPFLPEDDWRELRRKARGATGLTVRRWLDDLRGELARSRASVSQGGYCTAMDLLASGVPALVVPFVGLGCREGEQLERSRRLEKLGLIRVLEAERADAATLAREIRATLEFRPASHRLGLDGGRRTAELLASLSLGAAPVRSLEHRRRHLAP